MKNILVVDDSREARALLEMVLADNGYFPFTASSGREAIELIQKLQIDLIISDLEMDNGDGHWLLKELKRLNLAAKIIIVSGDMRAKEEHLKLAGALAFFRKPYTLKQLMDYVKSVF